jgi:hypothetical protein
MQYCMYDLTEFVAVVWMVFFHVWGPKKIQACIGALDYPSGVHECFCLVFPLSPARTVQRGVAHECHLKKPIFLQSFSNIAVTPLLFPRRNFREKQSLRSTKRHLPRNNLHTPPPLKHQLHVNNFRPKVILEIFNVRAIAIHRRRYSGNLRSTSPPSRSDLNTFSNATTIPHLSKMDS